METKVNSNAKRTAIKVSLVAAISLLLLIPLAMIKGVIEDREQTKDSVTMEVANSYAEPQAVSAKENLNEIRFKGWTEKEWLDNDYIRELRKYINACSEGEIKDQTLLAHKEVLKSKFIMGHIEPATYGGVFIYFTFLDAPRKVFYTQVYSYVNPDTKKIDGYEVRGVFLNEEEIDYTREAILYIVENYPEHKLW